MDIFQSCAVDNIWDTTDGSARELNTQRQPTVVIRMRLDVIILLNNLQIK